MPILNPRDHAVDRSLVIHISQLCFTWFKTARVGLWHKRPR